MNHNISIIKNPEIHQVKGFHSGGISCGIKKSKKLDLALAYSERIASAFALYTRNRVKSAHIHICKKHLKNNRAKAVIVNSGVANTCTGQNGIINAIKMCETTAIGLKCLKEDILPFSTGVIGRQLPMDNIISGIHLLLDKIDPNEELQFSKAIMTTDTRPKIFGIKALTDDGKEFQIIGTAKGAGMIAPNMATLLVYLFTDVNIKDSLLKKNFTKSINSSFNSITIDGDTSTNDTAIIMKNGMSENKLIKSERDKNFLIFKEGLNLVTRELAKEIVRDGEGATKLVEIEVINAKTEKDAFRVASSVANSSLVKTAFFGEDANWGRILCATGYSGVKINPEKIQLHLQGHLLFKNGEPIDFEEKLVKKDLQNNEIKVLIDLNSGSKTWKVWTSDLTYDYVKINASYTT